VATRVGAIPAEFVSGPARAECYALLVITFIRHGQAGSRQVYDTLSETGHRQAGELGEWLAGRGVRFDRVLTGRLNRQRETAVALIRAMSASGAICPEQESEAGWDEFDLDAVYAGIGPVLAERDEGFRVEYAALRREMADPDAAVHRQWRKCDVTVVRAWIDGVEPAETGFPRESYSSFAGRVHAAFLALPMTGNVAVVTSATPIALCAAMALDLTPRRVMQLAGAQHNTGYSEMELRAGEPRLVSFNNTPHLGPDMKTLR